MTGYGIDCEVEMLETAIAESLGVDASHSLMRRLSGAVGRGSIPLSERFDALVVVQDLIRKLSKYVPATIAVCVDPGIEELARQALEITRRGHTYEIAYRPGQKVIEEVRTVIPAYRGEVRRFPAHSATDEILGANPFAYYEEEEIPEREEMTQREVDRPASFQIREIIEK